MIEKVMIRTFIDVEVELTSNISKGYHSAVIDQVFYFRIHSRMGVISSTVKLDLFAKQFRVQL